LKKLQKLTVSITTDANVGKGEMADLKYLTSLRKLTITWSEIPSILEGDTEKVKQKREELVKRWTSFQLPKDLMKLDIRCYPKEELKLDWHEKLEKLYLRGGDMKRFSTNNSTSIKTLRLRYLKKFTMEWKDICSELQNIEYVEIVVDNKDATREKDKNVDTESIEEEIKRVMKIPNFTLDGHGVWTKDEKEERKKLPAPNKDAPEIGSNEVQKDAMGKNEGALSNLHYSSPLYSNVIFIPKHINSLSRVLSSFFDHVYFSASGPSEPTEDSRTKDASAITSVNKDGDKVAKTTSRSSLPKKSLNLVYKLSLYFKLTIIFIIQFNRLRRTSSNPGVDSVVELT
jgi:hypothetical protein